MEQVQENKQKHMYSGIVVSDSMDKTIVVAVERTFLHPVFQKICRTSKKYKVHDETEQASVGDVVEFYEGRPCSKHKYMYLARVVNQSSSVNK